jgi:hypothetical protein
VIERSEREEAMKATIADVLLSGDFNPLEVSIVRPRRPHVDIMGEVYWEDTGVVMVQFVGLMPIDDIALHEVSDEDCDVEGLEMYDDDADLGTCDLPAPFGMGGTPHFRLSSCHNWRPLTAEELKRVDYDA